MTDYKLIEDLGEIEQYIGSSKAVDIDVEATSLNTREAQIVGIGLSIGKNSARYIPIMHRGDGNFVLNAVVCVLRQVLKDKVLFLQNAKYDAEVIYQNTDGGWNIWKTNKIFDTMIMAYMLGQYTNLSQKFLVKKIFDYDMLKLEDFFGGKKKNIHVEKLTALQILDYACDDVNWGFKLFENLAPRLKAMPNGLRSLFRTEMELIPYVQKMERAGVKLNEGHLKQEAEKLNALLVDVEKLIFDEVSEKVGQKVRFDIMSPKDVGDILYDYLGIPILGMTPPSKRFPGGQRATNEKVLNKAKKKYSIIQNILTYRRLVKAISSYVELLPKFVEDDGRIHASFHQAGREDSPVPTGRFSSSNPSLQNIPVKGRDPFVIIRNGKKEEHEVAIRRAFEAEEGYYYFDPDYSQVEYKIIVGEAGEIKLIRAFDNGADYHCIVATMINGNTLAEVTEPQRVEAKTTNFRLIYGGGAPGLADALDCSLERAKDIIRAIDEMMPAVAVYKQNLILNGRRKGYVETHFGRRRYEPLLNSPDRKIRAFAERSVYNTASGQGSGADVLKIGFVALGKAIDEKYGESWVKVKIILTVHDENLLEVRNDIPPSEIWELCKEAMEMQIEGWPKITIDAEIGKNWGELEKYIPDSKNSTNSTSKSQNVVEENTPQNQYQTTKPLEKVSQNVAQKIILQLKSDSLSDEEIKSFTQLLDENPGNNLMVIRTDSKDYPVEKHKTSLGLENAGLINTAIACNVFREDVKAEELL